jgi:hypothetical protein
MGRSQKAPYSLHRWSKVVHYIGNRVPLRLSPWCLSSICIATFKCWSEQGDSDMSDLLTGWTQCVYNYKQVSHFRGFLIPTSTWTRHNTVQNDRFGKCQPNRPTNQTTSPSARIYLASSH